jgi:tellurite methyltransferase
LKLAGWEERYRSQDGPDSPNPLLVETAQRLKPGRALDLACGTGRNALWLASRGWAVTAVDGSSTAIEKLRTRGAAIETHVADLEKFEFTIPEAHWDLILMCYYLQRNLFDAVKRGVRPGGVAMAIVHIVEPGESPTVHSLASGELARYFERWEILHSREGASHDPAHRRASAEIVARRITPSFR